MNEIKAYKNGVCLHLCCSYALVRLKCVIPVAVPDKLGGGGKDRLDSIFFSTSSFD